MARRARLLLIGLVPLVAVSVVLLLNGVWFDDFLPDRYSDGVYYEHQVRTFWAHGFDGGYYTLGDRPPAIGFLHFGVHGPFFPVVYGGIFKILGWSNHAFLLVNLTLLGLAMIVLSAGARLSGRDMVLLGVFVLAFYPVLMFAPTAFQEGFHLAIAIAIATPFALLVARGRMSRGGIALLVLSLALLAFARLTWALLLVPLAVFATPRSLRAKFGWLAAAAVLVGLLSNAWVATAAKGGNLITENVSDLSSDPLGAVPRLLGSMGSNFLDFLLPSGAVSFPASEARIDVLNLLLDWSILAILGWAGLRLALRLRSGGASETLESANGREYVFHLLNLGVALLAQLFIYDAGYNYRILAAPALVSFAVMIARSRRRPVLAYIAAAALAFPAFTNAFDTRLSDFRPDRPTNYDPPRRELAADAAKLRAAVPYRAGAPTPWCNTIFTSFYMIDARLFFLPPGVTYGTPDPLAAPQTMRWPPKARYILLDRKVPNTGLEFLRRDRMKLLSTGSFGRVYLNLDSACREH